MSGTLRLRGATSGYSELQAPAVAADQTFVLPTAGGTLLTTDSPIPKLTLELGSASQPSLTFEGDTDTGLYSSGTNTLNLVTGGSNRLDIDSSGKVRIGTNTSRAHLTVAKGGSSIPAAGADTASAVFGNNAGAAVYGLIAGADASGTGYLQAQRTDGNTIVYPLAIQPNGGNVGIGTSSPSTPLHIKGAADCYLTLEAGTAGGNTGFLFDNSAGTQKGAIFYDTDDNYIFFSTNNSERLRIDADGDVGIGTGAAINLTAAGRQTLALNGTSETAISFSHSGSLAAFLYTSSTEFRMQSEISVPLVFRPNNSEAMRITSSGNVGIGTSSPSGLLSIHEATSSTSNYINITNNATGASSWSNGMLVGANSAGDAICWQNENLSLLFGTNNIERMRIYADGGVSFKQYLEFANSAGNGFSGYIGSAGIIAAGGSGNDLALRSGQHLVFTTGGSTEKMRINSLGNVGIGTTGPSQALDVESASTTTARVTAHGFMCRDNWGSASGLGNGIFSPSTNVLAFATNSTERMQIDSDGSLHHNSSSHGIATYLTASAGTSKYAFRGHFNTSAGTYGGTISYTVWSNGNVENTNDQYGQISDIKLKENIVDAGSQWEDFKAVRFRKYNFKKETGLETHTQLGVIAQELELTSPGLVYERADEDKDGNDLGTTTKAVKSSILTKKALVALQEAMARIEQLEAKVAIFEAN